jgi:hypothetical protein
MIRNQQGWAYCDVRPDGTITYYGVADAHQTQARPNVQAVAATRWVEEAVAWLGLQGWELVAVLDGAGRTFYFKRPLDATGADLMAERVGAAVEGVRMPDDVAPPDDEPGRSPIDPVRLIEEEFLPD